MLGQGLKLILAPWVWGVLRRTISCPEFAREPGSAGRPLIFASLHRDLLPAIMHVRSAHPSLLVSASPDGDILIRTLGRRHYGFVRGASGEDGQHAFAQLRRELAAGRSIGVAVDGPKGPFGRVKDGALQLCRLTGAEIVPLRAFCPRCWVLNTWDQTVVPTPLSRIVIERGAGVRLARTATDAELSAARRELTEFFHGGEVNLGNS